MPSKINADGTQSDWDITQVGSKAEKVTGPTLPIALAAGSFVTVTTVTNLPLSGFKRITMGARYDASFPNQFYVNHKDSGNGLIGATGTGTATVSSTAKEIIVLGSAAEIIINNTDAVAHNLTSLEIWKWAN